MNKDKILEEIKEIQVKILNINNALEHGRIPEASRKILGLQQKIEWLRSKLNSEQPVSVEEALGEPVEEETTKVLSSTSDNIIKYG